MNYKKIIFIVLFVLLLQLSSIFVMLGIDFIIYDNFNFNLFININMLPAFNYSLTLYGFILIFISLKLNDLLLYIYAYKISSKLTWYKFFRDREKEQQKCNLDEWNNYKIYLGKK